MKSSVRIGIALTIAALSTSCWFTGPTRRFDPSRPDSIERNQPDRPINNTDPDADRVNRTPVPEVPSLESDGYEAPPHFVKATRKGLTIACRPAPNRSAVTTASIRLSIPFGSTTGDANGVGTLAANVIVEAPQTIAGKRSLRATIEAMGGTVDTQFDGAATTFAISVRKGQWRKALTALAEALQIQPTEAQVEMVQQRLLTQLSERFGAEPLDLAITQVLTSRNYDRHLLDQIQDLTPAAVKQFLSANYKPQGAVLVSVVEGNPQQLAGTMQRVFEPWQAAAPRGPAVATLPLIRPEGTYWAPGGDEIEIAVIYDLLPIGVFDGVAYRIAVEAMAGAGTGSRLARQLRRALGREVPISVTTRGNGPGHVLIATFRTSLEEVAPSRIAIEATLNSIINSQPTRREVNESGRRVLLSLLRAEHAPATAAESLTRALLLNPTLQPELFAAPFQIARDPVALTFTASVTAIGGAPPTIVISGGTPPEEMRDDVQMLGEFQRTTEPELYAADLEEQKELAKPYLDRAIIAIGGRELLVNLRGYYGAAVTRTGRGPEAIDRVGYDQENGKFRRLRRVLATRIDTLIDGETADERVGTETAVISPADVKTTLDRIERHPLMLLAAVARGEAEYRLLSVRMMADRNFAILERVDAGNSRLRIEVDVVSGLIRAVQSSENRTGIGAVSIREMHRDYRNTLGIGVRAPFTTTTQIDNTHYGSVTNWVEFRTEVPPVEAFDRSIELPF